MTKQLLRLTDPLDGTSVAATWAGALFDLGARVSKRHERFSKNQLIVAISVPNRELAAVLIGAGWTLSRPHGADETEPLQVARRAVTGQVYRLVNAAEVVVGVFKGLDETKAIPRLGLGSSHWALNRVEALAPTNTSISTELRMQRPAIGSLGRLAGMSENWAARLAAPAADLALIGTKTSLAEDMSFLVSTGDDTDPDSLTAILSPEGAKASTWSTRIYSTHGFREELPLPVDIRLAVLDGQGAIRHLNDILTPVVICIFDRSIADQSASEQLAQLRNTRGTPISLNEEFGWSGQDGIEASCFTVGY
jgi:hypothetical protein